MQLRTRILLYVSVTCVCLLLGVVGLSSLLVLRGFAYLERQNTIEDVTRASRALAQRVEDLHVKSTDWAEWDDTYRFLRDHDPAYIHSNMVDQGLIKMNLDLILLVDTGGRLVYAKSPHRLREVAPPEALPVLAALRPRLLDPGKPADGFAGILRHEGAPLLVSARPILTSQGAGPARGWLIFGSYLSKAEVAALQKRTCLGLQVFDLADPALPSDCRQAGRTFAQTARIAVLPENNQKIAGYTLLDDVLGRPALILALYEPRPIYQQGIRTVYTISAAIALAALVFSAVVLIVLVRAVLSRLESLTIQVESIGSGDGSPAHVALRGRDELSRLAGKINGMLDALQEHAQIVQERTAQIEYQAFHDPLTDLPNRTLFMDRLCLARARATRHGTGLAVLFLDLDGFKIVNDSLGHAAGDRLLVAVAERLCGCCRAVDTVARLGGDEFTLLLEALNTPEEAAAIAERIAKSLRSPIRLDRGEVFASGSIGIAYSEDASEEPERMLRNADTAMYQAKTRRTGGYMLFDQSMNDRVVERMQLETGLHQALRQGELRVYYQPLVHVDTQQICGVEALLRWQHPTRGMVSPGEFIPIAEETGLIVPIGAWVLEEACRQAVDWQAKWGAARPLLLSVNVSGKQIQSPDMVEQVAGILTRTGFDPRGLQLEITESVLMTDVEGVIARLQALKALGVKIAIDDFGTGYSSLSRLSAFPLDTIKIDWSFVNRLGQTKEAAGIMKAVMLLARAMHLKVIGEGVETNQQLAYLRRMGCEIVQGYYFARPLTGDALRAFVEAGPPVQNSSMPEKAAVKLLAA